MRKQKFVSVLCIAFLLATMIPVSLLGADENRISGLDRYATAIAVSQAGWTAAENVVLAPAADANRTDALSAGPLAKALGAPILLTDGKTLTPATLSEFSRLGAKNVYIVSGTGVITQSVHDALSARNLTAVSLGGANRFETAVNIAKEIAKYHAITTVVFTSTQNDADALSMASLAAANGWVLFPAAADALAPAVSAWLSGQSGVTKTYVIGGTGLISEAAVASLPAVTRIGADDPYANNVAILEYFAGSFDYSRGLFVSSGEPAHLVDAVTASAYLSGAPLFLAPGSVTAGSDAAAALQNVIGAKTAAITAIGGTGAVSSNALTTVTQAASGTLPSGGGGTAPTPIPGSSGNNSLPSPGGISVSLVDGGAYSVTDPASGAAVNYVLLNVTGDYTKGEYALNGAALAPTPVLTASGSAAVVKLEAPAGVTGGALSVTQSGRSRLAASLTFPAAGSGAPAVLYGETPMAFSEFYHDITAGLTDERPAVTSFAAGGTAAEPVKFINAGTRTGSGP
ncbi:MAG: cell wall-binding repeat-containing protein, partial [Gracilibacteraceae bacterium]|nr:cell wall-binding repeat-containing protein [Gracilibacteraceae bacterium]